MATGENALLVSIICSSFITEWLNTGFSFLISALPHDLITPSPFWSANAYSLATSASMIWFARVADRWQPRKLLVLALVWSAMWCVIAGFSTTMAAFSIARAMQGIAAAAMIPAQFKVISRTYSKDPVMHSRVLALSGAMAAAGFAVSVIFAALSPEHIHWNWFFWTGALMSITTMVSFMALTRWDDEPESTMGMTAGWPGAVLLTIGLLLIAYTLATVPRASWNSPMLLGPLIGGVVAVLCAACYELKFTSDPVLPSKMFQAPGTVALLATCVAFYGALGIILFYFESYATKIFRFSRLEAALCWTPTLVTGPLLSTIIGPLALRMRGVEVISLSATGWILGPALMAATKSSGAGRWILLIVATVSASIGIDITYPYSTIYLTSVNDAELHGLVGALCSVIGELASSFALAATNIAVENTSSSPRLAYWIATGLATVGGVTAIFLLRTPALCHEQVTEESCHVGTNASCDQLTQWSSRPSLGSMKLTEHVAERC